MNNKNTFLSNDIIIEEVEISSLENNKIYFLQHKEGLNVDFQMQEITQNNKKLGEVYARTGT